MKALILSPLSLTCSLHTQSHHHPLHNHHPSSQPLFSNPPPPPLPILLLSLVPQITPKSSTFRTTSTIITSTSFITRANYGGPQESNNKFIDENGEVDDMDAYLNYLSLEYDSVWDTKPSWCQPWTITLTGVLAIAGSWLILHSVIVTTLVFSLISAWWYIFLYSYPKVYSDMIAERREKVTGGVEDTFGSRKSQ